jgi:hypothetical protein
MRRGDAMPDDRRPELRTPQPERDQSPTRRQACSSAPSGVSAHARPHLISVVRQLRRELDEFEALVQRGVDAEQGIDAIEDLVRALLRATRRGRR